MKRPRESTKFDARSSRDSSNEALLTNTGVDSGRRFTEGGFNAAFPALGTAGPVPNCPREGR